MNDRLEWTPEEFRRHGYAAVDAVAEFLAALPGLPARRVEPVEVLEARFGSPPPEQGRPFEDVLHDAVTGILPNTARVNHPRFFGFIPGPSNPAGALAELLAAGWNVFSGTWMGGGASISVERGLMRWLCGEFGLGPGSGGLTVSGGSLANLTALILARETHPAGKRAGAKVYFSDQTHSACERALRVLGYTGDQLVRLPSDPLGRLILEDLKASVAADPYPFCVIANAGTTGTGAVDPLPEIAALCREKRIWLHADAAFGGAAVLCERGKQALAGIGECDSIAFDPHKWLFQPFDLGCLLVREERFLTDVFRIIPAYMNDVYRMNAEINYCDRGLELTRPFRALKLWMSLQHFGAAAFRRAVERGFELAEFAQRRLERSKVWEILTPAQLGIVTFRHAGDDEFQKQLVDSVIADGFALLTSTTIRDRTSLRLCTINPRTTEEDIDRTVTRMETLARECASASHRR